MNLTPLVLIGFTTAVGALLHHTLIGLAIGLGFVLVVSIALASSR